MIIRYELTLTPLIPANAVLPGDRVFIDYSTHDVVHLRGATVVGVHTTNWPGILIDDNTIQVSGGLYRVIYEKEQKMPGQNVALTNVQEDPSGAVTFGFSDGTSSSFSDWGQVGEAADEVDASTSMAKKILVAISRRASPDGSNKASQIGASVSINCLADVPIIYTSPSP